MRITRTRSVLPVSVAALVAVVTLTVPAEAGDGVPPCDDACYNKDPQTYVHHGKTCDSDARTVAQKLEDGRTMQLRYSNRCETAGAGFTAASSRTRSGSSMTCAVRTTIAS